MKWAWGLTGPLEYMIHEALSSGPLNSWQIARELRPRLEGLRGHEVEAAMEHLAAQDPPRVVESGEGKISRLRWWGSFRTGKRKNLGDGD